MISAARWAASWARSVKRSKRIIRFNPPQDKYHFAPFQGIMEPVENLSYYGGDYNKTAPAVYQYRVRGVLEHMARATHSDKPKNP
jgi:hypothetical protein